MRQMFGYLSAPTHTGLPSAIRRLLPLLVVVVSLSGPIMRAPAQSQELVWRPYLQRLTDTGVVILWTTHSGTQPQVRYGLTPAGGVTTPGSTRALSTLGLQLHRVELAGLQPATVYYYQIFVEGEDLLPGQPLAFRTAPSVGSATPFTFLAFGDYGNLAAAQLRLRDQMQRDSFHFIVTTGDNAYQEGTYQQFDTNVFDIYGDVFDRAPIFPTLGNHDVQTANGAPYLDLFELPANAWRAGERERYYSFDYGNAHIVGLDSNGLLSANDSAATDDMFDWLRADLGQTQQPWKIVAFHHAPYSTGSHGSDQRAISKLVPIFEAYGVDLVLAGHDHVYQRTLPLRGGQVTAPEAGGIIYLVTGAGPGAIHACTPASWLAVSFCGQSTAFYARISVSGTFLMIEAVDDQGNVKDSFSLGQLADTPTSTPTGTPTSTPTGTSTSTPTASPTGIPVVSPSPSATVTPVADEDERIWLPIVLVRGLAYGTR
jgi:acid phosphatase type 7